MSTDPEEGWTKPTSKMDSAEITISSHKKEAVGMKPERIEKRIGVIFYKEGDTFQIGKNGKAIINRAVPTGHQFAVYVHVIIEKLI